MKTVNIKFTSAIKIQLHVNGVRFTQVFKIRIDVAINLVKVKCADKKGQFYWCENFCSVRASCPIHKL